MSSSVTWAAAAPHAVVSLLASAQIALNSSLVGLREPSGPTAVAYWANAGHAERTCCTPPDWPMLSQALYRLRMPSSVTWAAAAPHAVVSLLASAQIALNSSLVGLREPSGPTAVAYWANAGHAE